VIPWTRAAAAVNRQDLITNTIIMFIIRNKAGITRNIISMDQRPAAAAAM
jgi:hypothetical protein